MMPTRFRVRSDGLHLRRRVHLHAARPGAQRRIGDGSGSTRSARFRKRMVLVLSRLWGAHEGDRDVGLLHPVSRFRTFSFRREDLRSISALGIRRSLQNGHAVRTDMSSTSRVTGAPPRERPLSLELESCRPPDDGQVLVARRRTLFRHTELRRFGCVAPMFGIAPRGG